jgi:hypothetical protein
LNDLGRAIGDAIDDLGRAIGEPWKPDTTEKPPPPDLPWPGTEPKEEPIRHPFFPYPEPPPGIDWPHDPDWHPDVPPPPFPIPEQPL